MQYIVELAKSVDTVAVWFLIGFTLTLAVLVLVIFFSAIVRLVKDRSEQAKEPRDKADEKEQE